MAAQRGRSGPWIYWVLLGSLFKSRVTVAGIGCPDRGALMYDGWAEQASRLIRGTWQ